MAGVCLSFYFYYFSQGWKNELLGLNTFCTSWENTIRFDFPKPFPFTKLICSLFQLHSYLSSELKPSFFSFLSYKRTVREFMLLCPQFELQEKELAFELTFTFKTMKKVAWFVLDKISKGNLINMLLSHFTSWDSCNRTFQAKNSQASISIELILEE